MFFCITKDNILEDKFANTYEFKNYYVHTDSGWKKISHNGKEYLYKGYINDKSLSISIYENNFAYRKGNYCVIEFSGDQVIISHNKYRSFPLYVYKDKISNINYGEEKEKIHADGKINIGKDFAIDYTNIDQIGNISTEELSEEEVLNELDKEISNTFKSFLSNTDSIPLVFLSGGVDTGLVFSYLQKYSKEYKILDSLHFDFDNFWCCNARKVSQDNWSYKQLHHFKDHQILISGTPGDEYLMRNPTLCNIYLSYYDIDIVDFLRNNPTMYHTKYFLKKENITAFNNQKEEVEKVKQLSEKEMKRYICNMLVNDFQHHHIGNTITFTPLRDLKLVKLMMQLPLEVLLKQASDAYITKKLIAHNNPEILEYISPDKNKGEEMCYVSKLLT